ncbi:MAG: PP2C family protein-serine/threonine phosphatase [Chloroflexota bacterium]
MDKLLQAFLRRLYPNLDQLPHMRQDVLRFNLSIVVLVAPLSLLALVWLVVVTDTAVLRQHSWLLLLHLALLGLMNRYPFTLRIELRRGFFVSTGSSLSSLVVFAVAFLVGPTALWLLAISALAAFAYSHWHSDPTDNTRRWNDRVTLVISLGYGLLGGLAALAVYELIGGRYPLADLSWPAVAPALAAIVVLYLVPALLSLPQVYKLSQLGEGPARVADMLHFSLASSALSSLQYPFAILAAALWSQQGIVWYLFFIAGVWLAAVMANRLSQSVARSEQRARELAMLEQLGQAIIAAPADASTLPDLVAHHVEGMLPGTFLFIWLEPDQTLYRSQMDTTESWQTFREKLATADIHQWQGRTQRRSRDCLLAAIRHDDRTLLGGIFLQLGSYREEDTTDFLPVVQSLAGQIASAVQRAEAYRQALAHERMTRELQVAGEIQASFLPQTIPQIAGWDIAATLRPARQTSGDFYDFMDVGHGRLVFLVADVADKGTGAALFMALSRTLLRTYAHQYPLEPARVLAETNERILADTHASQFVTLFYAVLDLAGGEMVYANAGHNPALLLSDGDGSISWLPNSGPPLGVMEELTWQERRLHLSAGDRLLLYTDGVTEAQNEADELFTEARLTEVVRANGEETAAGWQTAVLDAVTRFSHQAPQFDDITLLTIIRQP